MTYYWRIELSFLELFAFSVYVDAFYDVPAFEPNLGELACFFHRFGGLAGMVVLQGETVGGWG